MVRWGILLVRRLAEEVEMVHPTSAPADDIPTVVGRLFVDAVAMVNK